MMKNYILLVLFLFFIQEGFLRSKSIASSSLIFNNLNYLPSDTSIIQYSNKPIPNLDRKRNLNKLVRKLVQLLQEEKYWDVISLLRNISPTSTEVKDKSLKNMEGTLFSGLGLAYRKLKKFEKSIEAHKIAYKIFNQINHSEMEAHSLSELASSYYLLGDNQNAINYFKQTLSLYKESNRPNQIGLVLKSLSKSYFKASQYKESIESSKKALLIFKKLRDRKEEGEILNILASNYRSLSRYEDSLIHSKEALFIAKERNDREAESAPLNNIGFVYANLSRYQQAISYFNQALLIRREFKNYSGEAEILGNIGQTYTELGKYKDSLLHHKQALEICKKIDNGCRNEIHLHNIALVYTRLSRYEKAIENYQKSLQISKKSDYRWAISATLNNLAAVYNVLNLNQKSLKTYQQALEIRQKIGDRAGEGSTLNNIGSLLMEQNKYNEAGEHFQKALAVLREVKDQAGQASTLNNMGVLLADTKNYDDALKKYKTALKINQRIGDKQGVSVSLNNIGYIYNQKGNYQQAFNYYQQVLAISREIGNRRGEAIANSSLGTTLLSLKQPQLAIVFFKNSVNTYESIREGLTKLPLEQQKSYTKSVEPTYRNLANLLIDQGRFPEAQAVLELLKLQEIKQFTRDAGIDSPGINLATIEETALKEILAQFTTVGNLAQKISACEQGSCSEDIQQLKAQRDQLNLAIKKELRTQTATLAKHYSTESATLTPTKLNAEARRIVNAQPGTLLIYPLVLKDKLQFLVAIKAGDGAVTFRPFESQVSAEQLFKAIQTFRTQLSETNASGHPQVNLSTVQSTSKQLYDWLIKPLEPELNVSGVKHLVFAPDSTIRYIPLGALFDGQQYLVERFTVTTITAASQTDTQERVPQPTSNQPLLLAMGASEFQGFSSLGNVPTELDVITQTQDEEEGQGVYPGSEFLNTAFDFEALKQNLSQYRILHLATHGKFQPGRPEDSYLVPGSGDNLTTERIDLLGDYGLSNIHLVVLSACETAVGDRDSNGIEIPGISYFFLKNEVKSVLASLWSVNDASTSLLMQKFYQHLKTKTKAEAMQQVQIQFIQNKMTSLAGSDSRTGLKLVPTAKTKARSSVAEDFSHPYYWAPFILIGNGL